MPRAKAKPSGEAAGAAMHARRSSGASASGSGAAAVAAADMDGIAGMDSYGDNTSVLARMEENLVIISKRPAFADIKEADPLKISEGGFVAPFSRAEYKKAMEGSSSSPQYHCGVNIFWLDPKFMAMPGVPFQQRVISDLADFYFAKGAQISPTKATIYIATTTESDPLAHKGSLQRVSPPEYVFAVYEALRRRIESKKGPPLEEWRKLLTSWPATFLHQGETSPAG